MRVVAPVLKSTRNPPDNQTEYRNEFGYLAPFLVAQVSRLRSQASTSTPANQRAITVSHTTRVVQAAGAAGGTTPRPTLVTNSVQNAQSGQKYLIMTPGNHQRPQTMVQQGQQIVRVVAGNNPTPVKAATVGQGATKVVVVGAQQGGIAKQQVQYVVGAPSRPHTPDVAMGVLRHEDLKQEPQ